jgi:hypothetical protein
MDAETITRVRRKVDLLLGDFLRMQETRMLCDGRLDVERIDDLLTDVRARIPDAREQAIAWVLEQVAPDEERRAEAQREEAAQV